MSREVDAAGPERHDALLLGTARRLAAAQGAAVALERLGRAAGCSPFQLQRVFRRGTGLTPKECATGLRYARFRRRVRAGEDVTSAGYGAGFGSSRGLYATARADLGMTPARYARRGAGLAIAWRIEPCAYGRLLVANTADGVCAVLLGDDDAALEAELADEFRAARLVEVTGTDEGVRPDRAAAAPGEALRAAVDAHAPWAARVLCHVADTRLPLGVPLDLHGTPFELRVWRALREIPAGATRRYAEVAASIGSPRAARAVGGACARNVCAVLVPCHRVIAREGGPGGYRWGPARKARLLEAEASSARSAEARAAARRT